jgi:signal transduction histidine kinase
MPKVLGEFGLIPALEEMLEKTLKFSKLKYQFENFNITDRFNKPIELSLYRITQELVNNVIKHSGATQLSVQLFKNKEQLILIVEDNGSGYSTDQSDGHGLLIIKARLNTLNGVLNFDSSSGQGTIATIRVSL